MSSSTVKISNPTVSKILLDSSTAITFEKDKFHVLHCLTNLLKTVKAIINSELQYHCIFLEMNKVSLNASLNVELYMEYFTFSI